MAGRAEGFLTGEWLREMPLWARAILYWAALFATGFVLAHARAAAQNEGPEGTTSILAGLAIVTVFIGAGAAFAHDLVLRGAAAMIMGSAPGRPQPHLDLSLIRSMLQAGRWEDARAVLQAKWDQYPGNGELLREWERLLYDGMKAPSGMVAFLEKALPTLAGEDRAYACLRLAEIYADVLDRKGEGRRWAQRLVVQHPGSPMAAQARVMLDQLPKDAAPER